MPSQALDIGAHPGDPELIRRLQTHPTDTDAMMELYDHAGSAVWTYALRLTRSRSRARRVAIAAFVAAAGAPQVFDGRMSVIARMLLITHLQVLDAPNPVQPFKRYRARLRLGSHSA